MRRTTPVLDEFDIEHQFGDEPLQLAGFGNAIHTVDLEAFAGGAGAHSLREDFILIDGKREIRIYVSSIV